MYYNAESIEEMDDVIRSLTTKRMSIFEEFWKFQFTSDSAIEHVRHGFLRRQKTLETCVRQIFDTIPPDGDGVPSTDNLDIATVCLQSFAINLYGCTDNLAWIWVFETCPSSPNGKPWRRNQVGLRPANTILRSTFGQTFQDYLESKNNWFALLEEFRDSLAHRIPLYVPPFQIRDTDEELYRRLELDLMKSKNEREAKNYSG